MADTPSWADDVVVTPTAPSGPAWADPAIATTSPAAPLDKYQQAAIEERNRLVKAGAPLPEGYTARAGMGAGLGWSDEILAGATAPLEMMKRGIIDPVEAYRYTKARENLAAQKTRENTAGGLGAAAEMLGGLSTGAGVLGAGTRATAAAIPFTRATVPASVMNTLSNVGRGASFGAVAGAGEGDTLQERGQQAVMGGLFGGALGGVVPMAVKSAM